ncbi:hypothetical protein [Benzoatithermus flavus]|uniref:Uncharacterized protein n=1 Tax=Benzoatithermus flavus TaxID=3108223 RepID=A0ABU8XNP6_9PROT
MQQPLIVHFRQMDPSPAAEVRTRIDLAVPGKEIVVDPVPGPGITCTRTSLQASTVHLIGKHCLVG